MADERLDRWSAVTRGHGLTIRVVIAADSALMRAGLRALLALERGVQVLGEARDGREAVTMVRELRPHVLLVDLALSRLNGIEATRQVTTERQATRVLCLATDSDEHVVSATFQAGAAGYLLKDSTPEELVRAIRVVYDGHTFLSPAIASTVVQGFTARATTPASSPFALLTDREREVLQLIAEGHETKQIAQALGVSAKTVASHRERLQHKLNVQGVAGLTRYALTSGMLSHGHARLR